MLTRQKIKFREKCQTKYDHKHHAQVSLEHKHHAQVSLEINTIKQFSAHLVFYIIKKSPLNNGNKKPSEMKDAPQMFFVSQYCILYSDKRKRLEGHNFGRYNTMDGLET